MCSPLNAKSNFLFPLSKVAAKVSGPPVGQPPRCLIMSTSSSNTADGSKYTEPQVFNKYVGRGEGFVPQVWFVCALQEELQSCRLEKEVQACKWG